jgi:hypothetical protein
MLINAITEVGAIKPENPREALARLEEILSTAPPDFDDSSPNSSLESFSAYRWLAHTYYEAGQAAHDSGYWEKQPEFYNKSAQISTDAFAKLKVAFAKFSESYESGAKQVQFILDTNAEDVEKLKAKDEKEYTSEDVEARGKVDKWESDLKLYKAGVQQFSDLLSDKEKIAKVYNPEPPMAELVVEQIEKQLAEIDSYKAGPGDKAKWVEGIVANHSQYMANYTKLEDKITLVYRLMALAPGSKTAPILLDVLRGKAAEAELRKAVTATAQANKKPVKK